MPTSPWGLIGHVVGRQQILKRTVGNSAPRQSVFTVLAFDLTDVHPLYHAPWGATRHGAFHWRVPCSRDIQRLPRVNVMPGSSVGLYGGICKPAQQPHTRRFHVGRRSASRAHNPGPTPTAPGHKCSLFQPRQQPVALRQLQDVLPLTSPSCWAATPKDVVSALLTTASSLHFSRSAESAVPLDATKSRRVQSPRRRAACRR